MNAERLIVGFILTSIFAGFFGALAMEIVMFVITRAEWAHTNMVVALGSLITHTRENAFRTGLWIHAGAALAFAAIYDLVMIHIGVTKLPTTIWVGTGFGVIHGIVVSLMLVWVVCERHPLEEFQDAGFAVGLTHFAGHIAYGAVVGLVIGIASAL